MADVKLNFQIVPTQTAKELKWTTTQQNSTPQAKDISEMDKNKGHNCIIMGRYAQTKEGKLISKYNGIQGGITDEYGNLNVYITISVTECTFQTITLYFDKIAQQYPTTLMVDGKTIYNDDYELSILFDEPKQEHTIRFTKWIRPNYHWCITDMEFLLDRIVIGKSKIKHIQSLVQLQPTQNEPFYSIVKSTGDFEFRDNEFVDYARDGILKSGEKVSITVNDKVLDTFAVSEWDEPNITNNIIGGSLSENIESILNTKYDGYQLRGDSSSLSKGMYLSAFVEKIFFNLNQYGLGLSPFTIFEDNIWLEYPYINPCTIRELLDKIATISQRQYTITKNEETNLFEVDFVDARPRLNGYEKIIKITANAQENDFVQTIIPKNNYSGLSMNVGEFDDNNYGVSSNDNIKIMTRKHTITLEEYIGGRTKLLNLKVPFINEDDLREQYGDSVDIATTGIDLIVNTDNGDTVIKGTCTTLALAKKVHIDKNILLKDLYCDVEYKIDNLELTTRYDYSDIQKKITLQRNNKRTIQPKIVSSFSEFLENTVKPKPGVSYITIPIQIGVKRTETDEIILYFYTWEHIYAVNENETDKSGEVVGQHYYQDMLNDFNLSIYSKNEINSIYKVTFNNESDNILEIKGNNELLRNETRYQVNDNTNISIVEHIADTIKEDYTTHNGIRFANLTVRCGVDFYDTKGKKAIDWNDKTSKLPNALKVGQIVKILDKNGNSKSKRGNGEDIVWRIIGCEFTHEYIPSWHLELMEVW